MWKILLRGTYFKIILFLLLLLFANEQSYCRYSYSGEKGLGISSFLAIPTPIINITSATCTAAGTASIANYNAANTYQFIPAGPTILASGAILGMIAGTSYTVTASNGGFVSAASGAFSISAPLTAPVAPLVNITPATCELAGTAVITNYNPAIIYVFNPTGPTVAPGGTILEMTAETNYIVTASIGGCTITAPSAVFKIPARLAIASRPVITTTAASCTAAGTASVANYNAGAVYVFAPTGPTVLPGGAITGMTAGTSYTVTTSNEGCTTAPSAVFSIMAQATSPSVPAISITDATCEATGTATITNYNAADSYTFFPAGPVVAADGMIAGMAAGTSYTVTAGIGGCASLQSGVFSIAAALSEATTPVIKITAPTCNSGGTASIDNYDANAVYTFTPAGPTVLPGGAIDGMIAGTSYTVTATTGSCTSAPSRIILVLSPLAIAAPPEINIIAAGCAADGAASITNYTGAAVYTFSPAGPTVSSGGAILGVIAGTNYTVVADIDGCATSTGSEVFSIQPALPGVPAPVVNIDAADCMTAGTASILNYDDANSYAFNPAGPAISTAGIISGMIEGTSYIVTAERGGCTAASGSFSISAPLLTIVPVPAIKITLPTCTVAGTASITNYNENATYMFTPAGPVASGGGAILGMIEGRDYIVTASISGCAVPVQSDVFSVQPPLATLPTPAINTITAGCTTSGGATIANYNEGAVYTFTPAGPTVTDGGVILGMEEGTNYSVTASSGGCTTAPSGLFSISSSLTMVAAPAISITAPTCTNAGIATITNYNAGAAYVFTPAGPTVSSNGTILGMTEGTNYIAAISSGACTTVPSEVFNISAQQMPPVAPSVITKASTCVADGTTTISNFNAAIAYRFSPDGPLIDATGLIKKAMPGTQYTLSAVNGSCTANSTVSFINEPMKQSPMLVVTKSNNIDCAANVAKLSASSGYTYSWSPSASLSNSHTSDPVATPTSTTVYHVVATNETGCTTEDSIEVKVLKDRVENGYQVANAFTPNYDGKNDCFGVSYWGAVTNFRFTIYNRWGEIVFKTSNVSDCWDGKYNGREQGPTGFPYIISADTKCGSVFRKGLVVLIK